MRSRLVVRVFLGSIAVNAALAIYALLSDDFGDWQRKVLLTSLSVSGSSILAFLCEPARRQGRLGPIPVAGEALSIGGFSFLIAAVWNDFHEVALWKTAGTLLLLAMALAHASLLSLCRLAPRFAWTFRAAFALGLALAATVSAGIWGEVSDEWFWRSVGVVAVLLAALALAVPVLHLASRRELAGRGAAGTPSLESRRVRFCPYCAESVDAPADSVAECPRCHGAFRVQWTR